MQWLSQSHFSIFNTCSFISHRFLMMKWCWLGVYYIWFYHCNDMCGSTPIHFDTEVHNEFWHISLKFIFSKHNKKIHYAGNCIINKFKDCRMLYVYQLVVSNPMGNGDTKRNPKTTYKNPTGIGSFYFNCKAQYDQLQWLFHYTFVYVQRTL